MKFHRYQVKKDVAGVLKNRHPWIFRSHLSSAAEIFKTGDKLKLVGSKNETLGFGIFDREGLIAIRVIKVGRTEPTPLWIGQLVRKAIEKRKALRVYTDSFRVIHGENDGLPGIVVEVYRDTLILQVYAASMDPLGRYVACWVAKELGVCHVLIRNPKKRIEGGSSGERALRVLRGRLIEPIKIHEGKYEFTVMLSQGQKTGSFLDLRGLRKNIAAIDLKGKRVLNLFCYTGTLGKMAEVAGAREIWNVDTAKGALEFARKYHCGDPKRHRFIEADIFMWLETLGPKEKFDLIIFDPPNMGTKKEQVPQILKTYSRLYRISERHLKEFGQLIACCCTSRISRKEFGRVVDRSLTSMKLVRELAPEDDHPVSFPEGDYLKIRHYEKIT